MNVSGHLQPSVVGFPTLEGSNIAWVGCRQAQVPLSVSVDAQPISGDSGSAWLLRLKAIRQLSLPKHRSWIGNCRQTLPPPSWSPSDPGSQPSVHGRSDVYSKGVPLTPGLAAAVQSGLPSQLPVLAMR